jgi:hypothetical protein
MSMQLYEEMNAERKSVHLQVGKCKRSLFSPCRCPGHLARCWKLSCCSEQREHVLHALVEVGFFFGSPESPLRLPGIFGMTDSSKMRRQKCSASYSLLSCTVGLNDSTRWTLFNYERSSPTISLPMLTHYLQLYLRPTRTSIGILTKHVLVITPFGSIENSSSATNCASSVSFTGMISDVAGFLYAKTFNELAPGANCTTDCPTFSTRIFATKYV